MLNNLTIKYAYEIDEILGSLKTFSISGPFTDKTLEQLVKKFKKLTKHIQPTQETEYDETWSYWIPIPTGSFSWN